MPVNWIGRVFGARYRLDQLLGSGAFADVYEAFDQQLERPVAVKVLRPEWATDPHTVAAFRREAELAAGLHHVHLAQVYDAGSEDGLPYLVMERVPGAPLDSGARPGVSQAVDIAGQIAGALAFIHDNGLLHSDLKPANVLVTPDGQAKLVDFGGAGPVDETRPLLSATDASGSTQVLPAAQLSSGSLPYLAPERLAGALPSPATDVYGLGAVLYTLLAGRPPYAGDTLDAVRAAQAAGPAPPLRDVNPTVPPALDALVSQAIAPDPEQRFPSAGALESALDTIREQSSDPTIAGAALPLAASAPTVPALIAPPAVAPPTPAPYVPPVVPPPVPPASARVPMRARWALPVVAGLLLLGVLILAVTQLGGPNLRGATIAAAATTTPARTPPPASPTVALRPAPKLIGLTRDQAQAAVQPGGWTLVEAPGAYNAGVAAGLILAQQPEVGALLAAGAPITITTSLGPAPAPPTSPPAANPPAPPAHGPPAPPAHNPPPPPGDKGNHDKGNDKKGKDGH